MDWLTRMRLSPAARLALLGAMGWAYGGVPFYSRAEGEGDSGGGGSGKSDDNGDDKGGDDKGGAKGGAGKGDDKGGAKGGEAAKIDKTQYDAVLKERDRLRSQFESVKKKLDDLTTRMPTEEELNELRESRVKAEKAEEERKKKAGEFDAILEKDRKKHAEEVNKLKGENESLKNRFVSERIGNTLASLIPKFTTVAVSDVAPIMRPFIKLDPETEEAVVRDANDEPILNEQTGKPFTPEEFIEAEIAKRPHFATFKPKGGSGSISQRGAGGGSGFTAEQIATMSAADWAKHGKDIMRAAGGKR